MATWVRVYTDSTSDTDYTYLNLDHVQSAQVIATVGGPAGYTIEFTGDSGAIGGSVWGRWDTPAHANSALQLLVRGVDLGSTLGEEV